MKVALYSPYLDTFGGGERYMLAIAEILSKKGDVDITGPKVQQIVGLLTS